mmetsp:Transcript_54696/g.138597  ORF Transcript_54696/g.138597 Transcript_54696/m.138597 type:complete len:320 (+) Transcript_54696:446-1405(+)
MNLGEDLDVGPCIAAGAQNDFAVADVADEAAAACSVHKSYSRSGAVHQLPRTSHLQPLLLGSRQGPAQGLGGPREQCGPIRGQQLAEALACKFRGSGACMAVKDGKVRHAAQGSLHALSGAGPRSRGAPALHAQHGTVGVLHLPAPVLDGVHAVAGRLAHRAPRRDHRCQSPPASLQIPRIALELAVGQRLRACGALRRGVVLTAPVRAHREHAGFIPPGPTFVRVDAGNIINGAADPYRTGGEQRQACARDIRLRAAGHGTSVQSLVCSSVISISWTRNGRGDVGTRGARLRSQGLFRHLGGRVHRAQTPVPLPPSLL